MNTLSQPTTQPLSIEEVVSQYSVLSEQIKLMEKAMKELRPQIEAHVANVSNTMKLVEPVTVKVGSFAATLTPKSRENFDLKTAKVMLGDALNGFFKPKTEYLELKVTKVIG